MAFGETEADYGEQGPEDFDRFGARHYVHIHARRRNQLFVDVDAHGVIKRLGLTLRSWRRKYYNVEHYHLDVNGRPLEIRSYSDGRIKLLLDEQEVYAENIAMVLRHGERYRDIRIWRDPAVDTLENREQEETARAARLDAVRAKLTTTREA